ncbi:MAG: LssY C-terminal domain-containing protein [Planctomycetaceae bacterium]
MSGVEESVSSNSSTKTSSRISHLVVTLLLLYFAGAYVVTPLMWEEYAALHPRWADVPRITRTGDRHPGDPLNVAIIGTEADVKDAMQKAGWFPADALSMKSSLEIAEATVLDRKYEDAPVSSLFLYNRRQDLAFEKPVGDNPKKRHHVRFWQTNRPWKNGQPVWVGSATYDERVGLSYTTGQITHHIDGDVDHERDQLMADLEKAVPDAVPRMITSFHVQRDGHNGGGDHWKTDGSLKLVVLPQGR